MTLVPVVMAYMVLTSTGEPDPLVGNQAFFQTHFIECDDRDRSVGVFSFTAEPIPGARLFETTSPHGTPVMLWPTFLHAPQWSATWLAPERTQGPLTLQGRVFAEIGPCTTSIAGTVHQMHLITGDWRICWHFEETDHVPRYAPGEVQPQPESGDSGHMLVTLEVGERPAAPK